MLSLKHCVWLENPLSDLVSEFDVEVSAVTKHVLFSQWDAKIYANCTKCTRFEFLFS